MDQIKKKIEQFLMSTLVVTALVLLLIAEVRPAPPVQTAVPTTETTAPTQVTTESTVPMQVTTESTVPMQVTTEPTQTDELPQSSSAAMSRVTKALKEHPLTATSMTARCVYDPDFLAAENTRGSGADAAAFALAQLCGERKMNPVDAFWALVKEGIYDQNKDTSGILQSLPFSPPLQSQFDYDFSVDGVHELLTDALTLAAGMRDGLPMEDRLLGERFRLDQDNIFRSSEDCLCAYYVCYGDRSAHFLCFYFRGDEVITDVEFQLMNLHYASGDQDAISGLDEAGNRQTVTLLTVLELLMTGTSRAAEGDIPFSYSLEEGSVSITRYALIGSGESGHLTCCRIRR